jgi:hypothetical protein
MADCSNDSCLNILKVFQSICLDLGVPLCEETIIGPVKVITYLGLEIDAENQTVQIPQDKLLKAKNALLLFSSSKKIRLRDLQSIVGHIRAIPSGRAFLRRFYDVMYQAKKTYHFIRITRGIHDDAIVWLRFLHEFNGTTILNDKEWAQDTFLELFTDSSGHRDLGCGCYLKGRWAAFKWPAQWEDDVFRDMTYLELVP